MQTNNTPADFPIFLRLAGQRVVIVGGGQVALRKLRRVLRSGAQAELVANRLHADVAALVAQGQARHVAEQFQPQQLDGCAFVFAATDNAALNARVAEAAKQRGIFVNVVDNAQLSSAISPAIVDRTPVTIAVSSGGTAPVLARRLREDIERRLPAELGALARFIGRTRGYIKNRLPQPARRLLWERFLDSSGADAVLQGDRARGAATLAALAGDAVNRAAAGEVYLVGAGPGDPDLLTLRALRLMQQADVVFHDRLVDPRILDLVRRDAERIDVGKRRGHHRLPQEDINAELVRRAKTGQRVLRLKGGDPFTFGRGGEEAAALAGEGIAFQVVPGVTAANGCAAYAGIPLTHRDYAQACVFVTGHARAGAELQLPWHSLAQRGQTVVIYMGLTRLPQLCAQLRSAGLPADWPAAVVENGTRTNQRVITGTLATLAERVTEAEVTGTSLVIVGEVVKLHGQLQKPARTATPQTASDHPLSSTPRHPAVNAATAD